MSVRGVLIGASGFECIVRLTERDPLAGLGPEPRGTVGRWSDCVVFPAAGRSRR
jgi:hypothetical protein